MWGLLDDCGEGNGHDNDMTHVDSYDDNPFTKIHVLSSQGPGLRGDSDLIFKARRK